MPVFEYKGLTEAGKPVKGLRDADSAKTLRQTLRKEGVFVTEVMTGKEGGVAALASTDVNLKRLIGSRITTSDIAIMTRQLSVLLHSGVALVEALSALTDQVDNEKLKLIVSQVKNRVNEGSSLADSMAQHPKVFNHLYVNMIRAGERSGALDVVLARLAEFTENQARLKSKIVGTLTYPIIMVVVSAAILAILLTVVVPKVTKIFEQNKLTLPITTRILIGASNILSNYWWAVLIVVAGAIWGFVRWKRTTKGRAAWDRFVLKTPVFGKLIRMVSVARFATTLSTLLKSGVPLLTSLDIVKNVVANVVLSDVIEKARDSIREGESIAAPLKRSGEFPPLVYHMVAIGERSGQLEDMLTNVGAAYEDQVEIRVASLTSMLEPVMTVGMGGMVAFIVMSILLPILKLNTVMHG